MSLSDQKTLPIEYYLRKLSGQEKEVLIFDHNYVKLWSAHPDSIRIKPARFLFMKANFKYSQPSVTSYIDEDVDVENCDEPLSSPFDHQKPKLFPLECEKSLKGTPLYRELDDENEIDMSNMNSEQQKLYLKIVQFLQEDRLAKLSCSGIVNETLRKRILSDQTAGRIRITFSSIFWDMELLSWLHKTLLTTADISILSSYIDVLQILKFKVPTLIDRVLQSYAGSVEGDAVIQLLRKPVDPVLPILNQNKPKKLGGNPIILICPNSPRVQTAGSYAHRLRFWQNNLSAMCKVMCVSVSPEESEKVTTIEDCLELMMTSVRNKVTEVKNHYPNRPLVLLGWMVGALIASYVALQELVDAVICLGFPLTGVSGPRGDINDPLLNCKVPTLFIIGQHAQTCTMDDIEEFRARMKSDTELVMLGGSDDMLRMCPSKMIHCAITQNMVDRCLLDEVYDFLAAVFVKLPSTSTASSNVLGAKICTPILEEEPEPSQDEWKPEEDGKRRRRKPREYSPELSPVRKRVKHHLRQVNVTSKVRLSPSSSDSSSSGHVNRKIYSKSIPKTPEKRVGRPAGTTWRKRINIKPIKDPNKEAKLLRKAALLAEQEAYASAKSTGPKPLPFSKNILPKKNDPVDVEKAFGCDSSFLPRPLTPPEPEDTVSAEETEKVMAEIEAMEKAAAAEKTSVKNTIPERAFQPISDQLKKNSVQDSTGLFDTAVDIDLEPTKPISSTPLTTTMEGVLSKNISLLSPFQSLTSSSSCVSLIPTTTASSAGYSKPAIITVPSATTASVLASSPSLKGQPNKVIQLVAKGGTFTSKTPSAFASIISSTNETSEQEPCNLALLSDVAGMSESISDIAKKLGTSTTATLVKLAAPDSKAPQLQPMKCLKVIKTVHTPPPPMRADTTEEIVEKHLAIQALNKSIGIEPPSTSSTKETGYTVCYAKPDGSIISQSVNRQSYLTRPGSSPQGRIRGRPPFPSRPFRFLNM